MGRVLTEEQKEAARVRRRRWYVENTARAAATSKAYQVSHAEQIKVKAAERRSSRTPEEVAFIKRRKKLRYEADKTSRQAKQRQYNTDNGPAISARRRARRGGPNGDALRATCRAYTNKYRKDLKRQAITHYGGKCSECGEDRLEFLCLDHINDDGAEHRRQLKKKGGGGHTTYAWAKINGWPPILQVLCLSHNAKKEVVRHDGQSRTALRNHQTREEAVAFYGGKCVCCGENDPDILQLDHIDGGGSAHRQELRSVGITNMMYWAKVNGWPKIFRLACPNCNHSFHMNGGKCLHQLERERQQTKFMKCHQRVIRDRMEPELRASHPHLFDRPIADFVLTREPKLTPEVRKFIETYEWLGTVGNSPLYVFSARIDGVLACVVLYGHAAGRTPSVAIQRGASAPFAHKHLSSKLIGFSLRYLKKEGKWESVVGYSDPAAGEIGTIYSACNFAFLGWEFGAKAMLTNPEFREKPFAVSSLRRTSTLKRWYKQTYGENLPAEWLKPNGFKDVSAIPREILTAWYRWGDKIAREAEQTVIPRKGKWMFSLNRKRVVGLPNPKRGAPVAEDSILVGALGTGKSAANQEALEHELKGEL